MPHMTPTRYPNGVATEPKDTVLGNYSYPNPLRLNHLEDDFLRYAAADWTVTATTGTSALAAGPGGLITQTTAAALNDIQHNLKNPAHISIVAGNQVWFAVNLKATTAATSGLICGLQGGGTAFAPTDGIYFTKAAASASISLVINVASTAVTIANVATLSNATGLTLGFWLDGKANPTLYVYANDTLTDFNPHYGMQVLFGGKEKVKVGALSSTNPTLTLPTANLAVGFGIRSAGAAEAVTWDFVMAASEIRR